jgi:hypothetical protein
MTVNYAVEKEGIVLISIFNLAGEQVFSKSVTVEKGKQETTLNLEGLSLGTYICHIHTADQSAEIRIVKSK